MPSTLSSPRSWQIPAAAVFATMTSAIGLGRLIHPGAWVAVLLLVSVVIALSGVGLRYLGVPRALVALIQALIVVLALTALFAHDVAIGGILPGPGALHELANRVSTGGTDLQGYAPPTPDTPDITVLISVLGSVFALCIDILAVTCRRPVLTGAPILAVYLIPATREPGGLSWLAFACAAIGYLVLIGADGHERLGQWGRAVHHRSGRPVLAGATNSGMTRQISIWSILAALFIPLLIPATPQLFHLDAGGGGSGSGTIYLNQSVNIAQDLETPSAIPLFDYRTTAADPAREYFQQEVLTDFNGTQWNVSSSAVPMPPGTVAIPGLTDSDIKQATVDVNVNVNGNFGFDAVPSPYATSNVTGLSNIEIDANTLTVYMNDGSEKSREGTRYATVSTEVEPTSAQLQDATVGRDPLGKAYLSVPSDVQSLLKTDAEQITAGDTTPYQKAMSLQDYFLNNFKYTLKPKISGTGVAAIKSFLQFKQGFCQQFAATMAAMARTLGIPAVVAVGYTPGTAQADGSYEVTTYDAHAWPMLYFDGVGWVQFEPTPTIVSGGRAEAQPWTQASTQPTAGATAGATANATVAPTATSTTSTCQQGSPTQLHHLVPGTGSNCDDQNAGAAAATKAFASWGPLGVIPRTFESWFLSGNPAQIAVKLLLLLLIIVAGLPGAARLRRWRRRRRLLRRAAASGGPKPKLPERRAGRVMGDGAGSDLDPAADGAVAGADFADAAAVSEAKRELAFTAWEELREYARDLGYDWAESDTPRQLAGRLTVDAGFDRESEDAVGRVTTLVERAVYSPDPHIEPDEARALPGDVSRVRSALGVAAGRAARLRAAVLPTSSLDHLPWHRKRH
jgi:transglutaminase-like putative cysteine protease